MRSPHLRASFSVTVTKPVRRFNKDKLIDILSHSKYKSLLVWYLHIEDAYEGTTPQIRKHIVEVR